MAEQLSFFDEPTGPEVAPALRGSDGWTLVHQQLDNWVQLEWLRTLDRHFVLFLHEHGETQPAVLLAAAWVSHQLGRGHICLDMSQAWRDPDAVLSLPPQDGRREQYTDAMMLPSHLLPSLGITSLKAWLRLLAEAPSVAVPNAGNAEELEATAPLVLDGHRLYLRRLWRSEGVVARALAVRMADHDEVPTTLAQSLDALFGPASPDDIDDQRTACALALRQRLTVISGGPGTGKTTTVTRLLALLQMQAQATQATPLHIRLVAPTGKAAARLSGSIGSALARLACPEAVVSTIPTEASTVHRLLGARPDTRHFRHHRDNPLALDVLVVDEASMVDLALMNALLEALPAQARLILLGDKDQLASVEAGAVLGELCGQAEGFSSAVAKTLHQISGQAVDASAETTPMSDHVVTLRKSYRFTQESGIGALARAINAGQYRQLRACWSHGFDDIAFLAVDAEHPQSLIAHAAKAYHAYLAALNAQASPREVLARFGQFQVLCALRRGPWGVEGLNEAIAERLHQQGHIPSTSGWYAGRPVMVTRNDAQLGLYNGDIGIALPDEQSDGRLRVFFEGSTADEVRAVMPGRLNDVDTVFAMTVHKSQGSEFDHVLFVVPGQPNPIMTRELLYTGVTRARHRCEIATTRHEVLERAAAHQVWRASHLQARLERCLDKETPPR